MTQDPPQSVNTREIGYQDDAAGFWAANVLNPAEVPELQWPKNLDVYDKMRRTDDQVLSILRAVQFPILSTTWSIDATGCDPDVARHIADDLNLPLKGEQDRRPTRTKGRFDFDEHLRLALLKQVFGASFFEQVYVAPPDSADGLYHLKKLAWRPPRTIETVTTARDGGLVSIQQYGALGADGVTSRPIPVSALVAHVNDREGANWWGKSLLRSAWQFWRLKQLVLRVQAQTIERNGMGVNVFTSPDRSTAPTPEESERLEKADRDAGLKIARGLRAGTTTGAAIPFGSKMESKGVEGQLPDAEPALDRYDTGIARSVLAHFLTLGGSNSTGSYALGDTFANFFVRSLQAEAKQIRNVIQQHVIEDLVDANWGREEPAPLLTFDTIGAKQALTPEGVRALFQSGAVESDDKTEEFLRDLFDMPTKDKSTTRKLPNTNPQQTPGAPGQDPAQSGSEENAA